MSTSPFRQTVIFGAGALGSWLGARLDPPALLVARGEHAAAMRAHGLRIGGVEDDVVAVEVFDACPDPGPDALVIAAVKTFDLEGAAAALVIAAVKTFDLEGAAAALKPRLRDDTVVAILANGLAPELELQRGLDHPVVRIVAEFGVTRDGPGAVSAWGGRALLGPGDDEDRVAAALAPTGLAVVRVDDLRRVAWDKMAINCVANPLAALTGARNRDLVAPQLEDLRRGVVAEVMAVAAAEGVEMAPDTAARVDAVLSRSRNLNSMAQDVLRGRPTEIDHLNGFVAALGEHHGVDTPVNLWLADMVRLLVAAECDLPE